MPETTATAATVTDPGPWRGAEKSGMSYEEHRELEKAWTNAKRAELVAAADGLAEILGAGWTALAGSDPDSFDRRSVEVTGPDGARLFVGWEHYDRHDRFSVAVGYPIGTRAAFHGTEHPTATVRADRGAKAVAAAVTGKILPTYLPILAAARQAIADRAERAEQVTRDADHLAAIVGARSSQEEGDPRASFSWFRDAGPYGRAEVGSSVSLHLNNLTPDQAAAVLALIA